jgi:tetratricopeptide (TPR) repeat protein
MIFQAKSYKMNSTSGRPLMHNQSSHAMTKKADSPRRRLTRQELRDLDVEISFLEGIVRRDPAYVEALQILGDNYTRRGRFTEGLRVDERLSRLRPGDSVVSYNLACSYSLTQQIELAAETLTAAIDLGYHDFKAMDKDPDLENLRQHAEYKRIRAKIRGLQSKER